RDILLTPFNVRPSSPIGVSARPSLQDSLRTLVWPPLVFAAVTSTGVLALLLKRSVQCPKFYDDNAVLTGRCVLPQVGNSALTHLLVNGAPMIACVLVATLGVLFALAAQVGRWQVVRNTTLFLRSIALGNALTIALVLVAFSLANWGVLFLGQ